ncbi:hypothetical protein [Halopseudomonas sabulinigri]|uniref:Uncharacterized protein n=1 Tax=Halopseudomonas sabulinigri TaxID=472181 RepID=A0ABP9ZRM3_9GAMM
MAYNLHIRKENYWEIDNPKIDKEKWLSLCKADPTMSIQYSVAGINPNKNEEIVVQADNSCTWRSPKSGEEFIFYFSEDGITLGTEDIQIRKAKEIAASLGLKVYGDEGEEY